MNEELKLELKNILGKVVNITIFLVIPILLFYLMESYEHNAWKEVRPIAQFYNILLFELIAGVLFFVFGSGKIALRIEIVIALLYGLVNHYVMAFRSTPFVPWDIFSIRTAASVAGNYDFTPTKGMILTTLGFVGLFVAVEWLRLRFPYKIQFRVISAVSVAAVLGIFVNMLWDEDFQSRSNLYPFLFTPTYMTKVNGMAVTFAMDMAYVYVEKPAGYSVKEVEQILESYESKPVGGDTTGGRKPNIVVIMDEAFSDLSVLGDFTTNEDYMPYVHSLQQGNEDTITGNLTVSVCGGNTANTEFEFLTGHTMDFFPVGSIPYQQYIKGELPSLAHQLAALGYSTYGMHPYGATGWNRDKVYPWLGFETNSFKEDFVPREYIRTYVSDKSAFEKIKQTYENKKPGEPMFVFEVTMQNHGSYSELHENFTPNIEVDGSKNDGLRQYLSLLQETDRQLAYLIEYFSNVEEETVILFFGDHQPSDYIANQIFRLNGVNPSNLTEEQTRLRYQVPYVMWANFDIEERTGADMDVSFLGAELLQTIGMETTAYQNFLLEMQEVMALSNRLDSAEKEEAEAKLEQYWDTYQKLQYYYMFDYRKE